MKKGEMLDTALLIATNAHHGRFDRDGHSIYFAPDQNNALPENYRRRADVHGSAS